MKAQEIMDHADQTGRVWLGGEMEFPANEGPRVAYKQACYIAEQCGYIVTGWNHSNSSFHVVGGDIIGEVVCEWFDSQRKHIEKIEVWLADSAYSTKPDRLPA